MKKLLLIFLLINSLCYAQIRESILVVPNATTVFGTPQAAGQLIFDKNTKIPYVLTAIGDVVTIGVPNSSVGGAGTSFWGWVTTANVVTVRFVNSSIGARNPASGAFTIKVLK
jgi:hypothetical protein